MQGHELLVDALRGSRNGRAQTAEELSSGWTCKKRDGTVVPFDPDKIRLALTKCFVSTDYPTDGVEKLTRAVVNNLVAQNNLCPDVEQVQRLVIQQLWSEGLFEAAEHYQNYREERRKARLSRPISPEVQTRVDEMQRHFPTDLQVYQYVSKFARWREADGRRETWKETCFDRVLPWLFKQPLVRGKLHEQEAAELGQAMYDMEVSPALRVVQMAGPALDRCHIGAYNCTYSPIDSIFALPELLYILMQGSGAGFSVESDYVEKLPRVKRQTGKKAPDIDVPDTTEGWCDSYHKGLQHWFDGWDVWFNVDGVRKAGARLKIKGGRSSGPVPFLELMTFARNVILARQGRCLDDTDVHRLGCFTGRIVQVGGVRRAACISLSDLRSLGMRTIKHGPWWADTTCWPDGKYLSMANNSGVYNERPPVDVFMEEWLALVKSKSGERGIFNREAAIKQRPLRRKEYRYGINPCAEIVLRPYGACNLSIVIARPHDAYESLARKVRLATIFGSIQSTCTDFKYVRPEWKKNAEEERLLGVDIMGHADCPLLRCGATGRGDLLERLRGVVATTRREFALRFGINESAADTCGKPGGDSAVLFDASSGISDRYSDFQVRWCRETKDSPVARFLIDAGVPYAPAPEHPEGLLVFGFPRRSPEGATTRNSHTAIQQCEMWLETKKRWAEHSVSATIHVEEHEWPEVGAWVWKQEHWDHLVGLSFLPKDNGSYVYPPNEELTREQYDKLVAGFPKLNWAKLQQYELDDSTEAATTPACTSGGCTW